MSSLTYKDFIGLLRQAVMFYPKGETTKACLRPQSFIVLENTTQLNADNLGITNDHLDKDYYFSRDPKTPHYPIVALWEQSSRYENLFSDSKRKECFSFELMVLDTYKEDCIDCGVCGKRTIHDIYYDTGQILINIINFFRGVKYVEVSRNNELNKIWGHEDILSQMLNDGDIDSYTEVKNKINSQVFSDDNTNSRLYRNYSKGNLFGKAIFFEMCTSICPPCNFEYEKRKYTDFVLNCCG